MQGMTRPVVALCGRMRSGKDTVADVLCGEHGFARFKFASKLKLATALLFDLTPEQVEGGAKDDGLPGYDGRTPRELMQWLGTDVMQLSLQQLCPGQGRSFWCDSVVNGISGTCSSAVVTDMRFPHERDALRERFPGLITVRLTRGGTPLSDHPSETETDAIPADITIANDGTMEDLRHEVAERLLPLLLVP
jgi:hypothetical protein